MIRKHAKVNTKNPSRTKHWHSAQTLAAYRRRRNAANKRAHQSRKRNW